MASSCVFMRGLRFGLMSSIHYIGVEFLKKEKSSCVKIGQVY